MFESIARSIDREHLTMMEYAIKDGGREDVITKDLAPFAEALVRGQDDGPGLIPFRDHLEDEVGVGTVERKI
ncbi:hypothetical protein PSD17_08040 [Pseudonocardia sp. D17]|nr:hypothetical protein PSD17_08040 [Pseudonocardia sp. D17]